MSNHEGKKHLSMIDAVSTTINTSKMRKEINLSNKRQTRNLSNANISSMSNQSDIGHVRNVSTIPLLEEHLRKEFAKHAQACAKDQQLACRG